MRPAHARMRPTSAAARIPTLLGTAVEHHRGGRLAEAEALYREVLRMAPNQPDALQLLGLIAQRGGKHHEALKLFDKSLAANPRNAAVYSNRGNTLRALNQLDKALESFERALQLQPDYADAHCNRGCVLLDMKQYPEAIASFDRALSLDGALATAYANRSAALQGLGQHSAAVESAHRAIALDPHLAEAYHNRGNALYHLKQYQPALESIERAMQLGLDGRNLEGTRLLLKYSVCDWRGSEESLRKLEENVAQGRSVTAPFIFAVLSSSIALQRKAADVYLEKEVRIATPLPPLKRRGKGEKIRLGYFSADYHDHATCHLIAELFEKHDRSQFELIGFSFGPDAQDAMRQRIVAGLDRFVDVRAMTDRDVAQLSRELEIDVAVDLKGFTADHRIGIFAHRAAPIQVNYLGFPGTLGAEFIDYMVADETTIPEESRKHYSEQIVYLPDSYQVNDRKRRIADTVYTRAQVGLPESGFVFCSFNSNYKITPRMFDVWMGILRRVEDSVLWLMEENAWAANNLRTEAVARGIAPERLVFAPRMALPEHLSRHRLADLFLDTLPCNAHTTASDALWAGLPVLTCMGETFAGRVAASLVRAIGLPELVTASLREYEGLAVAYALTPGRAAAMKQRLQQNRLTTPLFDSEAYTRHLETAYTAMYERYLAQLPADPVPSR